ncbi:MAG TPA: PhoPQ-activated protein PqaA family protein [Gammaproteobacteria bacterium]
MIRTNACFTAIRLAIKSIFLLLLSAQAQALTLNNPETALKDYIAHDDGAYSLQAVVSQPGPNYTAHVYRLTSQTWLTTSQVSSPEWQHTLVMIVPDTVNTTSAMLFVGDGKNTDGLPDASDQTVQIITQLALGSQSIVAAVYQTPNQPLQFAGEPAPVIEDKLVSYTWDKAMDTGNYAWSAYLPMTKSVVKAMDGVQSAAEDHGYQVNDFVLTGFSKRGAAVWLAAAVDARVKAIAPGVIDFLNIASSLEHHYRSYGYFSEAVSSYQALGILDKLRSPEFRDLSKVIDPYAYRDLLTMPKFMLNSSGDQFFLPDSSRFYFDELKGETHIRFAPNTDHSLTNSQTGVLDSLYSLLGWYQSILYGLPRPVIDWQVDNNALVATTSISPLAVKVWTATNDSERDFRKDTIGEAWTSTLVSADSSGKYVASLNNNTNGYTATYMEFVYQGLGGIPVTYSTQIYVTPDTYPFELNNPVKSPKTAAYWQRQLRTIINGGMDDIDPDTLNGYLPIPLFDRIIDQPAAVYEALRPTAGEKMQGLSERECMATRLNIKQGEYGWYSDIGYHWPSHDKPLWEYYKMADDASKLGLPWLSATICRMLNSGFSHS